MKCLLRDVTMTMVTLPVHKASNLSCCPECVGRGTLNANDQSKVFFIELMPL